MSGCIWAPPGWPFGKILSDQKMIGQCQLRKNNFNNLITAWFDEKWDASHLQWQLKLIRFDGREKLCLLGGVRKNIAELQPAVQDTIVRLLKDTIGLFAMFPTAQMCLSRSEKWCLRKIHHGLGLFSIQHSFSAFQARCCLVLFSSFDHRPSLSKIDFEVLAIKHFNVYIL